MEEVEEMTEILNDKAAVDDTVKNSVEEVKGEVEKVKQTLCRRTARQSGAF